jgi:DNA invertase Pin-like site-specific DNA recombinase
MVILIDAYPQHDWLMAAVEKRLRGYRMQFTRAIALIAARMAESRARGEFNMIAAWSVDRLSRSLTDLVGFLTELQATGVDLYLHQQALDTSTPSGRAMFRMCGVFAEFERSMIRERVNAGLARARENDVSLGRPKTTSKIEDRIRELRADGMGILKIGRSLGVGTSVVQRVVSAS